MVCAHNLRIVYLVYGAIWEFAPILLQKDYSVKLTNSVAGMQFVFLIRNRILIACMVYVRNLCRLNQIQMKQFLAIQ